MCDETLRRLRHVSDASPGSRVFAILREIEIKQTTTRGVFYLQIEHMEMIRPYILERTNYEVVQHRCSGRRGSAMTDRWIALEATGVNICPYSSKKRS